MTDLFPLSVPHLLHLYQTQSVSPADVIRSVYQRIQAAGNDHVWIYLVPEETALEYARSLDAWSADRPLYGVPFAVKDNIDVAGIPTTAGCPAFARVPERSATAVEKALAAGAILIGKTNMDQFATGLVGTRSPYGACASVFHPEYISGGSSSGSAVAVAKSEAAFSLGTDTAGSGRVPAAFNGLVGVKPTRGLISTAGVVPACRSLDCVSIFAPDVESGALVLEVLAGKDERDSYSRSARQMQSGSMPPKLGIPPGPQMQFFGDGAAEQCWSRSVERALDLGADVVEVDFSPFQEAAQLLYSGPFVAERYAAVGEFVAARPETETDPTVRQIILGSAHYTAVDVFRAEYKLSELRQASQKIMANIDGLLLPTAPTIYKIAGVQADPLTPNSRLGAYTNFVNLLDMAAIAVPAGLRPDGLPFGITLLGPAFSDAHLLRLAHWWEGTQQPRAYLDGTKAGVLVAVVGAHLRGQPLNHQLTTRGARFLRAAKTAPFYRLFALSNTTPKKPGLLRVEDPQSAGIEVEVWQLNEESFGSFIAEIPPPLGIGTLELADGAKVKGFICEPYALQGARDITHLGGWRSYVKQQ